MATGVSKTRVRELCEIGDKLFSDRSRIHTLWQETALNFYPERADFTTSINVGDEMTSHLMTGAPVLYRRDLANALSAMLRPREKPWFRARTHEDKINNDAASKAYLDKLSDKQQKIMYERRGQFVRATKQGDNDFATFGQAVLSVDPNSDMNGILFRDWHLRDVAWCENAELVIDTVHRNWKLPARNLEKLFKGKVHNTVKELCKKDPNKDVKCRHIVMPSEDYDYSDPTKKPKKEFPFVSIYVDIENDFILEETPKRRLGYVIPRWATVSGSQYAHSPATVIALPDARLLQQITLTLLEAGQKVVDPPSIGKAEAIAGGVNLYAGGHTWVDSEYDETGGEALRYLQIDAKGLNWAGQREVMIMELIKKALFLDQIDVPYPTGEMTATEYRGRVEQYIIRALPLFEPMEVEYNGAILEESFNLCLDMKLFGALDDMPQALKGQEVRWSFESPLQQATERAKSTAFLQTAELLKTAVSFDPNTIHDTDISKAYRDAVTGTGAPADWTVPEEQAKKAKAQAAEADAAKSQMEGLAQGAQVVDSAARAAESMGVGAQSLQQAGLV
jgi:hypothetical protein